MPLDVTERAAIAPALRKILWSHLDAASHNVEKLDVVALTEDLTSTAAKARRAMRNRDVWR